MPLTDHPLLSTETLLALRASPELMLRVQGSEVDELALQSQLRQEYPDDVVRLAMTLHHLRIKAAVKFDRASEMWFDRVGLEQATSELVAQHKAARFSGEVDDLCCGIGGDAIALAKACRVTAMDSRPAACLMTAWNAEANAVSQRVSTRVADVEQDAGDAPLVHIDPDRRQGAKRSVRIEDYAPSLPFLQEQITQRTGGAIKLSPASNFGGKFSGCEIELISLRGECKEATVWFGSLAGEEQWRATVLPSGETLAADPMSARPQMSPLSNFIYDPDPAVVRAGLINVAAQTLNLTRLDSEEEYLTSETSVQSAFVQTFEVLAELPNNDKQIRRYFREGDFGQVEIKSRHVRTDAEAVRRKLPLKGRAAGVLIYARIAGKTRAIVCRRSS